MPTQNIGLDGVVAQQENYKKSGFKLAYRNIRYEGLGDKIDSDNPKIILLEKIPFELIATYDDQIFPTKRHAFLKSWVRQPESLAIGFIENKKLLGYGMVRKCRTGYKVGPLFADTETIADTLLQKMRGFVGQGIAIFLDVPERNKSSVLLAENYKMKPMFETARMYTKEEPETPLQKVFGVTTFELG